MPNITKADNIDNLELNSSWVGGLKPTSTDAAYYDNTISAANAIILQLNSSATWQKVSVASTAPTYVRQGGSGTLTLLPIPVVNNTPSYRALEVSTGKGLIIDHPIRLQQSGGASDIRIFDTGNGLFYSSTEGITIYGPITSTSTNIIRKDGSAYLRLYADSPNHIGGWNIYQGSLFVYSAGALGTGTVQHAQGSQASTNFIISVPLNNDNSLPVIPNNISLSGALGVASSTGIQFDKACTLTGSMTVALSLLSRKASLYNNSNSTVNLNGPITLDTNYTSTIQLYSDFSAQLFPTFNVNGNTSGSGGFEIRMGYLGRANLIGSHTETLGVTITSGIATFSTTATTSVPTTIAIDSNYNYPGAIELGGRFPTLASINSPTAISTSSTGAIFLTTSSSENINWATNGYQLYLGSVTDGVVYSGTVAPAPVAGVPTYKFMAAQGKTFTVDTVLSGASNADIWVQDTAKVVLNKVNTLTGTVLLRGSNCVIAQASGLYSATAVSLGDASSQGRLVVADTSSTPLKLKKLIVGKTNSAIFIT